MTGTMITSISSVEMTTSRPCWTATYPDGRSTTMSHPASEAAPASKTSQNAIARDDTGAISIRSAHATRSQGNELYRCATGRATPTFSRAGWRSQRAQRRIADEAQVGAHLAKAALVRKHALRLLVRDEGQYHRVISGLPVRRRSHVIPGR